MLVEAQGGAQEPLYSLGTTLAPSLGSREFGPRQKGAVTEQGNQLVLVLRAANSQGSPYSGDKLPSPPAPEPSKDWKSGNEA